MNIGFYKPNLCFLIDNHRYANGMVDKRLLFLYTASTV